MGNRVSDPATEWVTSAGKGAAEGVVKYDPVLDPLLPPYSQVEPTGTEEEEGGIPLWLLLVGTAVGGVILAHQVSKK